VLPGLLLVLPAVPRSTWRPLHQSNQPWDITSLGFYSDNSQILPEAPRVKNTFCWCMSCQFSPGCYVEECTQDWIHSSPHGSHLIDHLQKVTSKSTTSILNHLKPTMESVSAAYWSSQLMIQSHYCEVPSEQSQPPIGLLYGHPPRCQMISNIQQSDWPPPDPPHPN